MSISGEGALPAARDARLTGRAETEHFEHMALDAELGVSAEVADELVDRAGRKRDCLPTIGANKVVAVPRSPGDVGRVAVGAQNAAENIDGGKELERAVDRGAADLGGSRAEADDHLLGGEGAAAGEDIGDDGAAGGGRAVAVADEELGHALRRGNDRGGEGRRIEHIQRVAQQFATIPTVQHRDEQE